MGRVARDTSEASARPGAGWLLLVGMAVTACGNPQPPVAGTPSTASADEVPFVVFVEPKLVIEGVGATASVPAAVGSTVSARTLTSSDPRVVEVTAEGALRARSAGRATIRATGNPAQALEVEVREARPPGTNPGRATAAAGMVEPAVASPSAGPLSLTPSAADLSLGQAIFFEVAAGGLRIQPQWSFTGPVLLQQTAPTGFVASAVGKTRLCVSSGQQSSCAAVVVSR